MALAARDKLKVINLLGPSGVGKSSVRSGLFWLMKSYHLSVEEVTEHAKYLCLMGLQWQLAEDQLSLLANQRQKQLVVARNGYDYAVTDSPLLLCDYYAQKLGIEGIAEQVERANAGFDNVYFFCNRDLGAADAVFEDRGRVHSREQSVEDERAMREFLKLRGIAYRDVPVQLDTPWQILDTLFPGLAPVPRFSELVCGRSLQTSGPATHSDLSSKATKERWLQRADQLSSAFSDKSKPESSGTGPH